MNSVNSLSSTVTLPRTLLPPVDVQMPHFTPDAPALGPACASSGTGWGGVCDSQTQVRAGECQSNGSEEHLA